MANAQDTRQTQALKAAASPPLKRKRTGVTPLTGYKGCGCRRSNCQTKYCPCIKGEFRCTLKCRCQGCDNIFGVKGSDQDTGFDMNRLPEEADEQAQNEEPPKKSRHDRGSDPNKPNKQ